MSITGLPPLTAVRAYLASSGWWPDEPGPTGALWRHPDHASPVAVPRDPEPGSVASVLDQLAAAEGRTAVEVAAAVREVAPADCH